jgi:hypothetical protein
MRPAAIVLGLALLIVIGGSALALAGSSSAHPAASSGPSHTVPGSALRAQSAASVLSRIEQGGEPPPDVTDALAIPAGSVYISKGDEDRGIGQYDESVEISVNAPEAEVAKFYRELLNEEKWTLNSLTSPAVGSSELIAQRNGSDGYQWRVGIVVRGVHVTVSPALGGSGSSAARSTVSLQLYQVEDAS